MHRFPTWQLFATCVLIWSTTWYAITFQVGPVAPEVGVTLRFALAGCVVLALCAARGERLRFTLGQHLLLALQGGFMYGVSYICVYQAERHLVSGLVAVGYSASPLIAGIGAHFVFGVRITRRFVAGGLVGLGGVALLFWPEFAKAAGSHEALLGAIFTFSSVLLSSVGSLTASRNRLHGLTFWPALGFGMLYGAATCALLALLQAESFAVPAVLSWWLSLLYLALAGSVMTFACYLTLQERIGPGPTGSVGVMTPLLALVISVIFEGLRPDALTFCGAGLAVFGNFLMLKRA
ncbi:MAG TPA: DMT family transporter [Steroidobacteraceae bacterium]|nr:DMT family transporter [Steroidobacteraceae bacterium]